MSPVDISAKAPPELDLLFPQRDSLSSRHFLAMALASILVHIAGGALFFSLPEVIPSPRAPVISSDLHKAVHLYLPKTFEPTQKTPNLTKVVRPELDVRSEREAPRPQSPQIRRPQPAPGPVAPPVSAPVPPPVIEPPKTQVATAPPPAPPTIAPPPNPVSAVAQVPPPSSSKPKLSFENVAPPPAPKQFTGPPDPKLLLQTAALERAQASMKPPGGGGVTVGDSGDDLSNLPKLDQAQSKGFTGSNLQLLSDPNGFDFQPYMRQVLAAVKRNWMAIIPRSATMSGRRGQVLIQFIIDRTGGVPKLVIATSSGTDAFDRAAVGGISASTPFPPLPQEFKGDQIRLQLAFRYNTPVR